MSRKQPNAYTKEDMDLLLDAAQVSKTSQLRGKTSFKDVIEILCHLNGMSMSDCMPKTNPGSGEPFTRGSFSNALLPSVLPSYKLTDEQIESIGRMFTPEKARARNQYLDEKNKRAECEKHARALKDVYDIEIPPSPPKPYTARKTGATSPLSRKEREIFSFIRVKLQQQGVEGYSALFPKDMHLQDWVEVLLQQNGKSLADVVAGADDAQRITEIGQLTDIKPFEFKTVAANLASMVKAFPGGVPALQESFDKKVAANSAGVAPNV